jgi:hypothetical protein
MFVPLVWWSTWHCPFVYPLLQPQCALPPLLYPFHCPLFPPRSRLFLWNILLLWIWFGEANWKLGFSSFRSKIVLAVVLPPDQSGQSGPYVICQGKLFSHWHLISFSSFHEWTDHLRTKTGVSRCFFCSAAVWFPLACISSKGESLDLYLV